jgi:hypothetical protein
MHEEFAFFSPIAATGDTVIVPRRTLLLTVALRLKPPPAPSLRYITVEAP